MAAINIAPRAALKQPISQDLISIIALPIEIDGS